MQIRMIVRESVLHYQCSHSHRVDKMEKILSFFSSSFPRVLFFYVDKKYVHTTFAYRSISFKAHIDIRDNKDEQYNDRNLPFFELQKCSTYIIYYLACMWSRIYYIRYTWSFIYDINHVK